MSKKTEEKLIMEQNKVSFLDPKTGEPLSQQEIDEMFMRRCLQLAKNGRQNAKPNPMVGAVIVHRLSLRMSIF